MNPWPLGTLMLILGFFAGRAYQWLCRHTPTVIHIVREDDN